jgi:hypothetical protein
VSSQRSRTAADDDAFLLSPDPVKSGCEFIFGLPSYSSPFLTHNDGTGRTPVHPKRPIFESQSVRQVAGMRIASQLPLGARPSPANGSRGTFHASVH